MRLQSSIQVQSGAYDFNSDGGSIGNVLTGVILPAYSKIHWFTMATYRAFTGGSLIGFGTMQDGVTVPITTVGNLAALNSPASYNIVDGSGNFQAIAGVDFNANPLKLYIAVQVIFTISTVALTDGAIQFEIGYSVNNF
jgi:hypothetical protein